MAETDWPPPETFADRLNRLRRHRGVSNEAIAEAAGVAAKTVSHWAGRTGQIPEGEALLRLARFFDVMPEWLLTGRGPAYAPPARKATITERPQRRRRKGEDR